MQPEEWNLEFVAELARSLAQRPGTDGAGTVADAVVLNDFYPAYPPSADREQPDGIRWLGPPPTR